MASNQDYPAGSQPAPLTRNSVVWLLSTPDKTEGSINDPTEREEHAIRFNEKWTYRDLEDDPAGARERLVYWLRYDFAGTVVRASPDANWIVDHDLENACRTGAHRFPADRRSPEELEVGLAECGSRGHRVGYSNPAITPSNYYRPVSKFEGEPDLGGHVQSSGPRRS
jgi:hypothetical protein